MIRTTTATAQLDVYENIANLSAQMASAAQENDWDQLIELERRVAQLRDSLVGMEDQSLSADDTERKRSLIHRILDDDAEVRRHTEPWMEQVRRFLGTGALQRRVENAYGAMR